MKFRQAKAIQVCAAATLVVVLISLATIVPTLLGIAELPYADVSMAVAVLVAIASFVVANVAGAGAARAACVIAIAIVGGFAFTRVFAFCVGRNLGASTLADGLLACGVALLFVPLCRAVWRDERTSASAA